MRRSVLLTTLATGAACALVTATPGVASAHGGGHHEPTVTVLNRTVGAPFQLDAARGGLLVADGSLPAVVRLKGKGLRTLATEKAGEEIAGVAKNHRGDLAWTHTIGDQTGISKSELVVRKAHGGTMRVDLRAYEFAKNPDARARYGIDRPTECQKKALAPLGGANSRGLKDSHAYAIAAVGDNWIVADAGGNDLLWVDAKGRIDTIAVLPRQPAAFTAEGAKALGLPACVVGAVYNWEPVPTDVEVTDHGLVVSLLPGGPEDPSLGARGAVYKVDWRDGRSYRIAGGFAGATNVAVDHHGRIYVAELFGGKVSVIERGKVRKYADLANALSLEWSDGSLYAGTLGGESGPGTIVQIR